jgi:hypothetical protein
VTSLFAFADGSTSVYRSDGTLAEGLSHIPGVADAARALLDSIETALPAFGPAELISLPQPGRVQFVAHARLREDGECMELLAIATRAGLADGLHPLSAAFDRANEVLRIAGLGNTRAIRISGRLSRRSAGPHTPNQGTIDERLT